nr:immunoglobulin light chain junction region [Macaca mulatta]
CMQALEFPWIF